MAGVVISDASPLIGLARVNGIGWLKELFGEVLIPAVVADELITAPLEAGWLQIAAAIPDGPHLPDLDEGEAASIRLALGYRGPALPLIDERSGRGVARDLGLSIAGTASVIGLARRTAALRRKQPCEGSGFRLSPPLPARSHCGRSAGPARTPCRTP